jgi:tRNA A37 N6-isopentenylltransferase MiaA
MRHPTVVFGLDVPRDVLSARIAERTRSMFERGAQEEARRALAGPISATALHIMGLRELDGLPREEAIAGLELRTRRYAGYQRKWMRRIPGLVSLDGTRPAAEIADEIATSVGRR